MGRTSLPEGYAADLLLDEIIKQIDKYRGGMSRLEFVRLLVELYCVFNRTVEHVISNSSVKQNHRIPKQFLDAAMLNSSGLSMADIYSAGLAS